MICEKMFSVHESILTFPFLQDLWSRPNTPRWSQSSILKGRPQWLILYFLLHGKRYICRICSFIFWRKLMTPKNHFEINWALYGKQWSYAEESNVHNATKLIKAPSVKKGKILLALNFKSSLTFDFWLSYKADRHSNDM